MKLVKGNVTIGIQTRFGANWPGKRCLAKTRRGTECQRAAYKHNGRCRLHGGLSTGARLRRAYSASQTLISSTDGRQKISWQPSATQRRSGVGFAVS
ncbi:MAG: HGGxSTG domain-containing protein [Rhodobacterales bacterium]